MDLKPICNLLLCLFVATFAKAQTYTGLTTDNYSGVHGLLLNPGNIADSRNEFDLNLLSFNANFTNDYASAKVTELSRDFNFNEQGEITIDDENNFQFNSDILGPSIMFSINPRNSIGLLTRARLFGNTININGNLINLFDVGLREDTSTTVANNNLNGTTHAWTEIGLAYGAILIDKKRNFLKAGVVAKLLGGRGFIAAKTDNFSVEFDATNEVLNGSGTGTYSFSENLDTNRNGRALEGINNGFSNALNDYSFSTNTNGIGFDFGLVYEWRPDHQKYHITNVDGDREPLKHENKYKFKIGISITDVGSITYKDALSSFYDFNTTIDKNVVQNGSFNREVNDELVPDINSVNKKINLPTALHLNADWKFKEKIYLNLNTDYSLIKSDQVDANSITNTVTLTPRYEKRLFGFYLPVTYQKNAGVLIGSGFRFGPVFAGSASIVSNLISETSNTAHFYAGVNIPVFFKKPKDADDDGVPDELDECPNLSGTPENKGCPGKKEELMNPEDEEDEEEEIADNNRDTDGDGIIDSLDECPYLKGEELNNGCPEKVEFEYGNDTAEDIETSFKKYSKAINFFYDKTEIQKSSFTSLNGMVQVMKDFPNSRYIIEGHTDATGPDSYNLRLSRARANAVKNYFVKNGIDPDRLTSKGFGETRPISTNATPLGRSKNRRVEIILIK